MKILLVSLNYHPEQTGIGKFQGETAAWLAARGHEVRALAAPPYYPEWAVGRGYSAARYTRELIRGVRVTRVPLYVPATPSGLKRLAHLASFCVALAPVLLWQALIWRPQAIVLTAPPLLAAPLALLAGRLAGARTCMHVQDFEVEAAFNLGLLTRPWMRRLALRLERAALTSFTSVSTISRKMREKLLEKGVAPERAVLAPNWANVRDFDPSLASGRLRERLGLPEGAVIACYSGNIGRKQGVETIVECARRLAGVRDIHFVVSGDGAGRRDMERQAEGLRNMSFLPVQPMGEFVEMMTSADIHLLPQRAEAADLVMPSKLGNILASGRPVVAGAAPGTQVHEAVQGCGLAVAPDSPEEFTQAVARLAADPELRAALGRRGRERALAEWDRDAVLMGFEAMLERKP